MQYFQLLRDLWLAPDCESSPRGMKTKELLGRTLTVTPYYPVVTIPEFKTNVEYAEQELKWYLLGSNQLKHLGKFAKCWEFFTDDGFTVNSAYGHRIFGKHPNLGINQWKWCLKKLKQDPDSRQCVINLNAEFDKRVPTKDFVCTIFVQPMLRNGKLHWFTCMRSTDAFLGIRNDVFCFTALQRIMARQLGAGVGKYVHFASSVHLYEKQFNKVKKLVKEHEPRDFMLSERYNMKWKEMLPYIKMNCGDVNWQK